VSNIPKEGGVCTFRNFDDDRFAAAFPIKILVQLETQLAHVNADRTIVNDTIILSFAEDCASDSVFGQILCMPVERPLGKKAQQIP
jgi:hypothetical protein